MTAIVLINQNSVSSESTMDKEVVFSEKSVMGKKLTAISGLDTSL